MECPAVGIDCHARDACRLLPGFYMMPSAWQTLAIPQPVRCPEPRACVGGERGGSLALCANGSTGPLCGVCSFGYYKDASSCAACPDNMSSVVRAATIVIGVLVAVLALLTVYLRSRIPAAPPPSRGRVVVEPLYDESDAASVAVDRAAAAALRWRRDVPWTVRCAVSAARLLSRLCADSWPRQLATLLKVLIAYSQMLYVLGLLRGVAWPSVFADFMRVFDITVLVGVEAWLDNLFLPFDCTFGQIDAYRWLLLTLLLPLACSALTFACVGAAIAIRRCRGATLLPGWWADHLEPAIWHIHIWFLLLLYPSLCRETLGIFHCIELDGTYYLAADTAEVCYTRRWATFAAVAILGVCLYVLGLPAASYTLSRRCHYAPTPASRLARGRRVALLLSSYSADYWWFETFDLLRKLLLTSVVLLVAPGTMIQLWFGLLIAISATLVVLKADPYRDGLCGRVQLAAVLQMTFNYMAAPLFFHGNDHDHRAWAHDHDHDHTHAPADHVRLWHDGVSEWGGDLLVAVNCAAFVALFCSLSYSGASRLAEIVQLKLRLADGSDVVLPPPAAPSGHHLMLSHEWKWGQDQCDVLKRLARAALPSMSIFLDIDDLSDAALLEAYVGSSDVLLVFLTRSYIQSANCMRELVEACRLRKPLLVVRETDDNHGAISADELRAGVEAMAMAEQREAAGRLVAALEEGPALEWHREKHLKQATLVMIVQALLGHYDRRAEEHVASQMEERASRQAADADSGPRPSASAVKGAMRSQKGGKEPTAQAKPRGARVGSPRGGQVRDSGGDAVSELLSASPEHATRRVVLSVGGPAVAAEARTVWIHPLYRDLVDANGATYYGQLAKHFGEAGAVVNSHSSAASGDGLVLLLAPGVLSCAPLVEWMQKELARKATRRLLPLFSTSQPFAAYCVGCPQTLRELGIFEIFYEKWPMSDGLQAAAAWHMLRRLQQAAGHDAHGSGGLQSTARYWRCVAALRCLCDLCCPHHPVGRRRTQQRLLTQDGHMAKGKAHDLKTSVGEAR